MLNFYIKSLNPKGHIEACSFISYFRAEILSDEIYGNNKEYYGSFYVNGSEDLFEVLSEFSSDLIIDLPPGKTIR